MSNYQKTITMKKLLWAVLSTVVLFSLSSCIACDEEDMDDVYEGFKDGYYGRN